MPVLNLTQSFIDHELRCPEGKTRIEYCDDLVPGLYVLASSGGPTLSYYLRYKDRTAKTCHQKIGRTTDDNFSRGPQAGQDAQGRDLLGLLIPAAKRRPSKPSSRSPISSSSITCRT
jgi:hypothetical protein